MHLKSYQIDGRLLGAGAANFSASGRKRQDNDLIVIESAEAAEAFKHAFDARFASGNALVIGEAKGPTHWMSNRRGGLERNRKASAGV
jgi:phosphatidylserine/phosphatidylglycerophosphate/cardiolipin synthase-like enzyme